MNEFNEALDKFINTKEHEAAPVFGRSRPCTCGWPEYAHGPYTKNGTLTNTHPFVAATKEETT